MTRIWQDGTVWRRMVDTAQRSDGRQWEELIARALAVQPRYRPYPGSPVYHIRMDDHVVLAAEHDLTGPLRDLVRAVITVGGEVLAARGQMVAFQHGRVAGRWLPPAGWGKLAA